jgi:DNA replication protein DnaC
MWRVPADFTISLQLFFQHYHLRHCQKQYVAFLNLAGEVSPSAIAQALANNGHGSLCFYGAPGTGKTAFAEVLAEALDRELVTRQASDLISPYVGETEQNLARLFRECDPMQTI